MAIDKECDDATELFVQCKIVLVFYSWIVSKATLMLILDSYGKGMVVTIIICGYNHQLII